MMYNSFSILLYFFFFPRKVTSWLNKRRVCMPKSHFWDYEGLKRAHKIKMQIIYSGK